MRNRFDEQLDTLNRELTEMGALCQESIACAVEALLNEDAAMAQKAFAADLQVDRKERDIESLCLKLLLQQQPVARDLRLISAALKMISDLERIGDQASDIAEITKFISGHNELGQGQVADMARAAIGMVNESIDAFVRKDTELAKKVIMDDDIVDRLFDDVKNNLISCVAADPGQGEYYLDLLMIAKYLERIGDHATNVAEWAIFSLTGRHEEPPEDKWVKSFREEENNT